ncbi:MAG TPA: serine/threonine-protein kinase [Polyangiaceae bacterium]|nr:serine/threonine-protein kinase [Polyangiaceae bacterium]
MTNLPKPPRSPTPPITPSGSSATLGASTIDLPRRPVLDSSNVAVAPAAGGDPYVGSTLDGRYVVERVLGEGGMGVVYAGRHRLIDKRVAIKVLRRDMASDRELNERFLQEARAASAIGNPHIVDISDFGQLPDGSTYFVMELLEGKSLSETISEARGPMPVVRLCRVAKQIAQGLAAAHAANIVHRDLKPDNVMLVRRGTEADFVKILDFGIAKVGGGTKKMTRAGSVIGTPHYMSPEQAAGAPVDHRTDVYALGVILYEMASGKVPFDADNFMGILTQHMYKAPVPIRALVPEIDVPAGLDAIVLKSLTKKPEGRYANMDEMLADLDKLERGLLPDAVHEMMARSGGFNVPADYFRAAMPAPVPAAPPAGRRKRWPLFALMGAVGTLVGVVAVVMVVKSGTGKAQPPAVQAGGATGATTPTPAPAVASSPAVVAVGPTLTPSTAPTVAVSAGVAAASEPFSREILVSILPSDATITQDGRPLGQSPVALHLQPGDHAVLVLEHRGFKTREVTVGSEPAKQTFTLEAVGGAPAAKPHRPEVKPAGAPQPSGIDDVGDPFAAKH